MPIIICQLHQRRSNHNRNHDNHTQLHHYHHRRRHHHHHHLQRHRRQRRRCRRHLRKSPRRLALQQRVAVAHSRRHRRRCRTFLILPWRWRLLAQPPQHCGCISCIDDMPARAKHIRIDAHGEDEVEPFLVVYFQFDCIFARIVMLVVSCSVWGHRKPHTYSVDSKMLYLYCK